MPHHELNLDPEALKADQPAPNVSLAPWIGGYGVRWWITVTRSVSVLSAARHSDTLNPAQIVRRNPGHDKHRVEHLNLERRGVDPAMRVAS